MKFLENKAQRDFFFVLHFRFLEPSNQNRFDLFVFECFFRSLVARCALYCKIASEKVVKKVVNLRNLCRVFFVGTEFGVI